MKKVFVVALMVVITVSGCGLNGSNENSDTTKKPNTQTIDTPFEKAMENYTKKTYYGMLLDTNGPGRERLKELVLCWTKKVEPLMAEDTKKSFIRDSNDEDVTKDLSYDYGFDGDEMDAVLKSCTKDLDEDS